MSGQDDELHIIMVTFSFSVSELWPFDCFLYLFCVIFILVCVWNASVPSYSLILCHLHY